MSTSAHVPLSNGEVYAPEWKSINDMLDPTRFLNEGFKGPQLTVLPPGTYRINPSIYTVTPAPVTDVTRGLPPGEFFCPGSVIKLELDPDPLTYGVPRETAGFCAFSGAFELSPAAPTAAAGAAVPTARIIGRYAKSGVLLSGWLEGEGVIAGKGAMVEVTAGLGRAILFAFRPQHRAQSHATFRLFFNALHTAR